MPFAVYIMASHKSGTLYVGSSSNLIQRAYQHRTGMIEGFSKKYRVHRLVYFELFEDPRGGIQRERNLKHWSREWKIALIEKDNAEWRDLFYDLF